MLERFREGRENLMYLHAETLIPRERDELTLRAAGLRGLIAVRIGRPMDLSDTFGDLRG